MIYLICVLLPPLAVLLMGNITSFVISLILTFFGWLPGVIHAFFVVADAKADRRSRWMVEAFRRENRR